jgi:glutamate synthase domain-containing protein 3
VAAEPRPTGPAAVSVPDVRDYQRINAELAQRLDVGHRVVRLTGAEGQRLLAAGLSGGWDAVVEVEGRAGPELAAGLNAPNLIVVAHGPAADGAGSGLRAGLLIVRGSAGAAAGYAQAGGSIVVAGDVGPRAGLDQGGGDLVLLGAVGPLAGERQSGGRLFADPSRLGPHAGRGRRGGRLTSLSPVDPDDASALRALLERARPWLTG